jgi:hypothetical protein
MSSTEEEGHMKFVAKTGNVRAVLNILRGFVVAEILLAGCARLPKDNV